MHPQSEEILGVIGGFPGAEAIRGVGDLPEFPSFGAGFRAFHRRIPA